MSLFQEGRSVFRLLRALFDCFPCCWSPVWLSLPAAGGPVTAKSANSAFSVAPGSTLIDTSCIGCNTLNAHAIPVHQFYATLTGGGAAAVTWTVSGGDSVSGPGKINDQGQYTPPTYLTSDRDEVQVTATLKSNPTLRATSLLTLTPGFLQPLTPENAAVGPNGSITVTGYMAEAGGNSEIHFALSNAPTGDSGGEGTLSPTTCQRTRHAFTTCSTTYTAPPVVSSTGLTYVVATLPGSSAKIETAVLLNASGVMSNPASHQEVLSTPMLLGSSGGNNNDFDEKNNTHRRLLQWNARRPHPGCKRPPVPAQQQPCSCPQRSRLSRRHYRAARPY